MANIMERAKVAAGDPMGRVRENLSEAYAQLGQHRMAKKIWKEVQDAMAESRRRAKKGKGLAGLGSSILGGVLGKALGVTNPLIGALIQAGTAGVAEKTRQDQARATAPIKQVLAKYKGRLGVEGLDQVIEEMQGMQKQQIGSDALISGLTSMAFPKIFKENVAAGELDAGLADVGQQIEGIPTAVPGARSIAGESPLPSPQIGTAKDMLSALIPGGMFPGKILESLTPEMLQSKEGQMILGLLRNLGPTAYKQMFGADIEPYWDAPKPQFRNPYRRY